MTIKLSNRSMKDKHAIACEWYNTASKSEIVSFCARYGVDILQPGDPNQLVEGWEDIAIDLREAHG